MKRRFDSYFPWLFSAGDFLASLVSLQVASLILQFTGPIEGADYSLLPILSIVWLVVSVVRKDYEIGRTVGYDFTVSKMIGTLFWFLIMTIIFCAPLQNDFQRLIQIVYLGLILCVMMGVFRVAVHGLLRKYRSNGRNYRNAVIVGKGGTSSKLAEVFNVRKDFGINFLGYFDDEADCLLTRGKISDFLEVAPDLDLDVIYVREQIESSIVRQIIDFADENYIKVKLIPVNCFQVGKKLSCSKYGDFFVINVNDIPLDNALNRVFKRTFDLLFASLVTIFILSWLIPLVGILIKLESPGSVFFVQKRNGVNNKVFNCLKFRSMTPNETADSKQAIKNDPRITKVGAFLRSTSLDEMPQFLNVLVGDMSIVGPRPHTLPMNKTFKTQMRRYNSRHKIRPGITGLAQVKGFRGEIENEFQIRSRVRLDYFYVNNWSFLLDMGIMVKTFWELILHRENAY